MAARVAPEGVPHWLTMTRADVAERPLPGDRLPGRSSTTRRPRRGRRSRASTRSIRKSARPSRSSGFRSRNRSCSPASRSTPCSTASRSATTFRTKLAELGIIFCSFSEAVKEHPELVRKYLGTVVPYTDNFFATLNSAVFSDGSFCLHPQGRPLSDGAVDLFPHQRPRTPVSSSAR